MHLKGCSTQIKSTAYKALVRPSWNKCCAVYILVPYYKADIDTIERVQRRAARFVLGDYNRDISVTAVLEDLGWETLIRRAIARLTLMYEIAHNLVDMPGTLKNHPN